MPVVAGSATILIGGNASPFFQTLERIQGKLNSLGDSLTKTGMGLAKVGALITTPFALATRTFVRFEDQMKTVQAVTGATGKEFEQLTARARELGSKTSFTAADAAEGLVNLSRAGFKVEESLVAVGDVLDVARAGAIDLGRAAELTADLSRAFDLSANEIKRVGDVIISTANSSSQTVEDLAESFKFVAPSAKLTAQTIEETAKALGILADTGLKGSIAGTALNQTLVRLAEPKVQKTLESYGVVVKDATGEFRPFVTILREFGQKIKNLPGPKKLALFKELFGLRGFRAAANIATASAEGVRKVGEAIKNSEDSAKETAKTMDSGLGGALRILNSAFQDLQLSIGNAIQKTLTNVTKTLTAWLNTASEWVKSNRELVVTIAKLGATILAFGSGLVILGGLAKAFAFLLSPIGLAISAIILFLDAFGIVNLGLTDLVGSFRVAGIQISTWMTITWIEILRAWAIVSEGIISGWEFLVNSAIDVGGAIASIFLGIAKTITSAFISALEEIASGLNYLIQVANVVAEKIGNAFRFDEVQVAGGVKDTARQIEDTLNETINRITNNQITRWKAVEDAKVSRAKETTNTIQNLEKASMQVLANDQEKLDKDAGTSIEEKLKALSSAAKRTNTTTSQRLDGVGTTARTDTGTTLGFFAGTGNITNRLSGTFGEETMRQEQRRTNDILTQQVELQEQTVKAVRDGVRAS